jgi:GNAT superfamily N-acetyltransferase
MVTVAPIEQPDLPALAVLFTELVDVKTGHSRMLASFEQMQASPDYILLGAKCQDRLVGFMMGIVCLDIVGCCQPFLVVENVVVAAASRRQGVARQLMQQLEAQARYRQCHYILLVTAAWRKDAHDYYASMGFEADKYKGFKKYLS